MSAAYEVLRDRLAAAMTSAHTSGDTISSPRDAADDERHSGKCDDCRPVFTLAPSPPEVQGQ